MAKKKAGSKPRPEHYEKSNLNIKGTFDEAMKMFSLSLKSSLKPATVQVANIAEGNGDFH